MMVRRTTPADVATVNNWLAVHGVAGFPAWSSECPGFMVDGLAAAWIYKLSDVPVAFLENLTGNPRAPMKARSAALDAVVAEAMSHARREGALFICAITSRPEVVRRSKRHGFTIVRDNASFLVAR
jgi:hypothetical protein